MRRFLLGSRPTRSSATMHSHITAILGLCFLKIINHNCFPRQGWVSRALQGSSMLRVPNKKYANRALFWQNFFCRACSRHDRIQISVQNIGFKDRRISRRVVLLQLVHVDIYVASAIAEFLNLVLPRESNHGAAGYYMYLDILFII